jgi:hypothetical protein
MVIYENIYRPRSAYTAYSFNSCRFGAAIRKVQSWQSSCVSAQLAKLLQTKVLQNNIVQSTVQQQYYAELLMSSKGNLSDSLQLLRVCFTHLHTFIGNGVRVWTGTATPKALPAYHAYKIGNFSIGNHWFTRV